MERKEIDMTDEEYLVLDELYFITDFEDLADRTKIPKETLIQMLIDFHAKGWVRCFSRHGEEIYNPSEVDRNTFRKYRYLISKEGLIAHHQKS